MMGGRADWFSPRTRDIVLLMMSGALALGGAGAHAEDEDGEDAGGRVDRIAGRASVGYLATHGNTESTNVNARLRLTYALLDWSHEFDLSVVSANRDDTTITEAYTGRYKARREFAERSYLFTSLDSQRDRFSAYDYQVSQAIGYGWRVLDRGTHLLNMEVGAGAQQAKRHDGTDQDEAILRAETGYRWRVNDGVSLHKDLVIEHGHSNTRTEAQTELRARLIGNIGLVLSYRIRHNSDVLPGRHRSDLFSSVSLEYTF